MAPLQLRATESAENMHAITETGISILVERQNKRESEESGTRSDAAALAVVCTRPYAGDYVSPSHFQRANDSQVYWIVVQLKIDTGAFLY